jgi:hypothetical protein
MKKTATLLLAATLATTLGVSSASATMPAKDENYKGHFAVKGHYKFSQKFKDVSMNDWALRFITEMAAKGVIQGDGNGSFRPSANVSHEEAIIMTIRAMGLTDEAMKLDKNVTLSIDDAANVSPWARQYVALALQKGFVDADHALYPTQQADRQWVTEMIVRAAGLQADADAHMEDTLAFNDTKNIDEATIGYISVAVDKKIISGYTDNTFQPYKAVHRNELAVMMTNADNLFNYDPSRQQQTEGQLQGSFKGLTSTGLAFETPSHQQVEYKFASNYYVFLGNKIATKDALKANMWVRVLLNEQGEVVFVQAKETAPKLEEIQTSTIGKVTSFTAPGTNTFGSITLTQTYRIEDHKRGKGHDKHEHKGHDDEDKIIEKQITLPIAPNATVKLGGTTKAFTDIQAGNEVKVSIVNNAVLAIELKN